MSHEVHIAVFALGCLYLTFVIVRRLIWGTQARLRVERFGARGAMMRDAAQRAVPAALFVLAAISADYTLVWVVLAAIVTVMGLGLAGVALAGRGALAEQDRMVADEGESEQRATIIALQKRQGRLGAAVTVVVLVTWVLAWWDRVI